MYIHSTYKILTHLTFEKTEVSDLSLPLTTGLQLGSLLLAALD